MDEKLTPEEKKKIYSDLFKLTFQQLEAKKLSVEEVQNLAEYVINNMIFIRSRQQMLFFLENLGILWKFFNDYLLTYKKEELARQDKIKINEISKKIFTLIN